ncbi:MAG: hypothetical protein ACLUEK_11370 [Oscillospiraceae bacterium]
MAKASPEAALQSAYLERCAGAPVFRRTQTKYFRLGDELFPALLEELKKAERFIFLEYFIVEPGVVMWDSILDILEEKAAEGLDVRLIYDDMGCIMTLPRNYYKAWKARHPLLHLPPLSARPNRHLQQPRPPQDLRHRQRGRLHRRREPRGRIHKPA